MTTKGIHKMNRTTLITTVLSASALLVGCNKTEEGATWGAGIGALAGQAFGGDTEATLIGAGVGALVGGAIGNDQDNQYRQQRNADGSYTQRRSTTRTILNPDGTYSTVGSETTDSYQRQDGYQGLP